MKYLVENIIWGWPLIIFILALSLYFCFMTGFVQFRYLKLVPGLLFKGSNNNQKFSPYQTVLLILANHIGTGNIIGVAFAIMYGGPGAIFWLWLVAVITSALSFMENTLGQLYKTEINGEYRGGAAYYIERGTGSRFWAYLVALVFVICLGILMPTIQAATIAESLSQTFRVSKAAVGVIVTGLLGYVLIGNAKRIVKSAEILVPFMAVFYLLVTMIVIIINIKYLDDVLILIFDNAINKKAVYGGIIGSAINVGMRRSIFTHEAGIGSSPNISASSNVSHPVKQGILSSFCIFIDTLFLCLATAIMILISGCYNVVDNEKYLYMGLPGKGYNEFVSAAINTVFHGWGDFFVGVAIFLFGFTALFGSFYNTQSNIMFIFKGNKYRFADFIYKIIFLTIIFISSLYTADAAWEFTDIGVGIAAFVNLVVIFCLRSKVIEALKDFALKYKKKEPLNYINNQLECWRNQVKE